MKKLMMALFMATMLTACNTTTNGVANNICGNLAAYRAAYDDFSLAVPNKFNDRAENLYQAAKLVCDLGTLTGVRQAQLEGEAKAIVADAKKEGVKLPAKI